MGQLSFTFPDDLSRSARRCLERACVTGGYDLSPMPTRRRVEGSRLTLTRDVSESGYLTTPWPLGANGCPVLMSSTLRERPEPYHLLIELARGKLNQVRCQLADWMSVGFEPEEADTADLARIVKRFGRAVLSPTDAESTASLPSVIGGAQEVGERFTRQFSEQLMRSRVQDDGKPDTRFGTRLTRMPSPEGAAAYLDAFNAVRLVPDWRAIEPTEAKCRWDEFDAMVAWAVDAGLNVSIGPLIDLTTGPFPGWLSQWEGDLPSLAAFMCDFVETIITRYRDRVPVWEVFTGFNHADVFGLYEDDRLRLGARLLEAARLAAPDATLVMGLSLPWGDYLTSEDMTYSPLVFADTLLRGGFTVGGLDLELLCGDAPRASQPRTILDTYRLLDLYALLGIPLELSLGCVPATAPPVGETPLGAIPPGWVTGTTYLAMSVTQVSAVYWDTWSADEPARVPGTALWTGDGPAGGTLSELRDLGKEHLR